MTLANEAPAARRGRRRAAARTSWAGGGRGGAAALRGLEEAAAAAVHRVASQSAASREASAVYKNGKVAEHATLLDTPPVAAVAPARPPGVGANGQPAAGGGGGASSRLRALWGGGRAARRAAAAGDESPDGGGAREPLVGGAAPPPPPTVRPAASLASLRRCETVLALTSVLRPSVSSTSLEPSRLCSRCSSLLTLASGSRYSLASAGFVPVATPPPPAHCKLCLADVPGAADVVRIARCQCAFCRECMRAYVEFEIAGGAYDIPCPDAQCPSQGVLSLDEIRRLAGDEMLEKHKKYRLNREVELDKSRTWCPRAGCETVCDVECMRPVMRQKVSPQSVRCPTCSVDFCSSCRLEWHEGVTCEDYGQLLAKEGKIEDIGIPFDTELIKCCPMCNVPIEKDEGCAQMMCKRCKHVFCWYCLASLDDDFLLRHYDKGPCKNKLGHSRASVIWHRAQVIGIFAGFGVLLLVASPLLLLAAPCIVCCKCRVCGGGPTAARHLDEETDEAGPAGSS